MVVEEVDGILSILREDMLINSSVTGTSLVRFRSVLTDYLGVRVNIEYSRVNLCV